MSTDTTRPFGGAATTGWTTRGRRTPSFRGDDIDGACADVDAASAP